MILLYLLLFERFYWFTVLKKDFENQNFAIFGASDDNFGLKFKPFTDSTTYYKQELMSKFFFLGGV